MKKRRVTSLLRRNKERCVSMKVRRVGVLVLRKEGRCIRINESTDRWRLLISGSDVAHNQRNVSPAQI
jgi:hypothetical protein